MDSDVRLLQPFRAVLVGSVGTGKTKLAHRIAAGYPEVTDKKFDFIYVIYSVFQEEYATLADFCSTLLLTSEIPSTEELEKLPLFNKNSLIIIDDREEYNQTKWMARIANLFTVFSRHKNTSIIFTVHDIFLGSKAATVVMRNASYLIIFESVRDKSSVKVLGRQLIPEHPSFLSEAQKQATAKKHGFLLIDLRSGLGDNKFKFRSTIQQNVPVEYYLPE